MSLKLIDTDTIGKFLCALDTAFAKPADIFLSGETTHVFERWMRWTVRIEFASSVRKEDRPFFNRCLCAISKEMNVRVTDEFPGEVIPLPQGYEERSRTPSARLDLGHLRIRHFDPYSIAFRFLARGLEQDYQLVLTYLQKGWIEEKEMDRLLESLLPSLNFQSIQQDPAEFRRRYSGLLQMWRAREKGEYHRAPMAS